MERVRRITTGTRRDYRAKYTVKPIFVATSIMTLGIRSFVYARQRRRQRSVPNEVIQHKPAEK
jgi:hypothetical protein